MADAMGAEDLPSRKPPERVWTQRRPASNFAVHAADRATAPRSTSAGPRLSQQQQVENHQRVDQDQRYWNGWSVLDRHLGADAAGLVAKTGPEDGDFEKREGKYVLRMIICTDAIRSTSLVLTLCSPELLPKAYSSRVLAHPTATL